MSLGSNNPGNIRYLGVLWDGLDSPPQDAHGFARFMTMEDGVRALCRVLVAYQDKHDLHTVRDIITRWAPPSENDTEAYIADVSAHLGVRPDDRIDVHDPDVMNKLASAISHHETATWLDAAVVSEGASRALA